MIYCLLKVSMTLANPITTTGTFKKKQCALSCLPGTFSLCWCCCVKCFWKDLEKAAGRPWVWTSWLCFEMQISVSLLSGEDTCTVWSNVGSVVQQGSNFTVYCSFKCTASRYPDNISMHCYEFKTNEFTEQPLKNHNSTTVYFKVYNITGSKTYSCSGECHTPVESCGLDMKVGCKCWTGWGKWGGGTSLKLFKLAPIQQSWCNPNPNP